MYHALHRVIKGMGYEGGKGQSLTMLRNPG
jgi:hypothetical protein